MTPEFLRPGIPSVYESVRIQEENTRLQAENARLKAAFGPTIELIVRSGYAGNGNLWDQELARLRAIVEKGTE